MKEESGVQLPNEEKLQAILSGGLDADTEAILRLAWQAGLLTTEISQAGWQDADFERRILHVKNRKIPMSRELAGFLSQMERKGPYIVYSRKNPLQPMNRMSITRRAREALSAAGMGAVSLIDLRSDYILRQLRLKSLEEVARITGCELRTLQELYRRCTGKRELPARTRKQFDGRHFPNWNRHW